DPVQSPPQKSNSKPELGASWRRTTAPASYQGPGVNGVTVPSFAGEASAVSKYCTWYVPVTEVGPATIKEWDCAPPSDHETKRSCESGPVDWGEGVDSG